MGNVTPSSEKMGDTTPCGNKKWVASNIYETHTTCM